MNYMDNKSETVDYGCDSTKSFHIVDMIDGNDNKMIDSCICFDMSVLIRYLENSWTIKKKSKLQ